MGPIGAVVRGLAGSTLGGLTSERALANWFLVALLDSVLSSSSTIHFLRLVDMPRTVSHVVRIWDLEYAATTCAA